MLLEAKELAERWRRECNTVRLRSSLGYRLPRPNLIHPIPNITRDISAGAGHGLPGNLWDLRFIGGHVF